MTAKREWLQKLSILGVLVVPYILVSALWVQNAFRLEQDHVDEHRRVLTQQLGQSLLSEASYYLNLMQVYCTDQSQAIEDKDSPLIACGFRAHNGEAITIFNQYPIAPHLQRDALKKASWWEDLANNSQTKLLLKQETGESSPMGEDFSILVDQHRFAIFENQGLEKKLKEMMKGQRALLLNRQGRVAVSQPHASRVQFANNSVETTINQVKETFDFSRETFSEGPVRFALYVLSQKNQMHPSLLRHLMISASGLLVLLLIALALILMRPAATQAPTEKPVSQPFYPPSTLAGMLMAIVAEKRAQYRELKHIQIDLRLPPNPGLADADVEGIEFLEILSHLIDNSVQAILHAKRKEGQIHVGLRKQAETAVEVMVSDNGCGIPEELMAGLGQRGYSQNKPGHQGLGLNRVARAAKRWSGTLKIASTLNRGTRIRLNLPLRQPSKARLREVSATGSFNA